MADFFIGGEWVEATGSARREIRCPADGSLVASVAEGTAKDTEAAIAAARRAFDTGPWPGTAAHLRGDLLLRTAELLDRDAEAFARAESLDTGKRLVESRYDMADIAACLRYFGKLAAQDAGRVVDTGNPDAFSRIVHEPVGVCGLITPWNYPLLQTVWKIAPALAAGNTFVLKPSELTPHTAILFMKLLTEAGLPPGVANLVLGRGRRGRRAAGRAPGRRPGVVHRRARDRPDDRRGGRRRRSRKWPSSWAGRTRTWSSPTPTSRRRSTTR